MSPNSGRATGFTARMRKSGVDEVDAERRALEQGLELLAAITQRTLELAALLGKREMRGDAGEQLARAERLDEIVVGAGAERLRCAPPRRRAPTA